MTILEEIIKLAKDGVQTDGSHHKQWYLEEILKRLAPLEAEFYDQYVGREGVPP